MIPPTVGRIVWFYPANRAPGDAPWAAIIANVLSDVSVNLCIIDTCGVPMLTPPNPVPLVQDHLQAPAEGRYCCWPPHTKYFDEPATVNPLSAAPAGNVSPPAGSDTSGELFEADNSAPPPAPAAEPAKTAKPAKKAKKAKA